MIKMEENKEKEKIYDVKHETRQIKVKDENGPSSGKSNEKIHDKYRKVKQSKNREEADYNPNRRRKTKSKKSLYLDENRNVIPNEINQIFSFISKKKKSEHLVIKLMAKYPPSEESYSLNRYYQYQESAKDRLNHYSTLSKLRMISELYEPECKIWAED